MMRSISARSAVPSMTPFLRATVRTPSGPSVDGDLHKIAPGCDDYTGVIRQRLRAFPTMPAASRSDAGT